MNTTGTWWIDQLGELGRAARAYLRRHFPAIVDAHDDIVNEGQAQLAALLSRKPSQYPQSWFGGEVPSPEEQAYLCQLSHTILRRRIADHYRGRLKAPHAVGLDDVPEEQLSGSGEDYEQRLTHVRMLHVCMDFIAALPVEDQVLVSMLSGELERSAPLSASERQRVHRLRRRLADEIERQLGQSVAVLLRHD